jgi:hypothetical protein
MGWRAIRRLIATIAPSDSADKLLQQVAGALVSYHARIGTDIDSNETFIQESLCDLLDLLEDREMAEEVRRRAVELGAPPR